jgi:hypothetical protein
MAKRNAYRILVGKGEGKRPLGRPRRRWLDNIKMDLGEIVWDGVDWIDIVQDRSQWRVLVNMVMKLSCPYNAEVLQWLHNQWFLKMGSDPLSQLSNNLPAPSNKP